MSAFAFTARTKARKRAADVIYEADQRGMGRNPEVLRDLLRERRVVTAAQTPLPEYSLQIIEGVAERLHDIDTLLRQHAKVHGLDRMPAVDLAVLRVAVWELLVNEDDVPPLVVIDEAVSIVKSISTDDSPAFVNAVLDAIRRDLETPSWTRERVMDEPARPDEPDPDSVSEPARPDEPDPDSGSEADTQNPSFADVEKQHPSLADVENMNMDELDELLADY